MSPLALVPIGIYALIVSSNSDINITNGAKPSHQSGQNVTLTENIIPNSFIEDGLLNRHNKPVLTQTAGLMDPIVKAAVKNSFRMQIEKNKMHLAEKASTNLASRDPVENPRQNSPQTNTGDDGGYSAPLGLKDDSHNDWMK
jgi:hypothetical protein